MSAARALPDLTRAEDYLAWVWTQPYKFETILGRIVMMAGGKRNHAIISLNASAGLLSRLAGTGCRAFGSDFLVQIDVNNRYFPDASVACGEMRDFTDRPVMVVEVLSPSTMREDLGPKLSNYLRIPGLRYVLCLWQDEPLARLWEPGAEPRDIVGLDGIVELPALGIDLPMAELYRDVTFDS
ncbi:MAG TPA: Uma2 family endonuclease [Geminicoccaceae bacterium]|nr:Uma2 family endonuclease [Geminicoccus sp.]HMU52792.1 Uma2 family endonuclease [Geminicoccaceae bacterium]